MQKDEILPWDCDCPSYKLFDLLGKKWTFYILISISENYNSFSALMKRIPKINSKVLSERLDLFTELELINREVSSTKPLKINYFLTEKWEKLIKKVKILSDFAIEEKII